MLLFFVVMMIGHRIDLYSDWYVCGFGGFVLFFFCPIEGGHVESKTPCPLSYRQPPATPFFHTSFEEDGEESGFDA